MPFGRKSPLEALALPGVILAYKYSQFRQRRREAASRRVTERELSALHHKIDKLLNKLEESEPEPPTSQEDECVICINARATMQTSPCGHRVVCRRCFVKTIQSAVAQRLLPLRCVICRARVNRLTSSSGSWRIQESASSFSVGGKSWTSSTLTASVGVPQSASAYSMGEHPSSVHPINNNHNRHHHNHHRVAQSASLYSMSSGSSSISNSTNCSINSSASSGADSSSGSSSISGNLHHPHHLLNTHTHLQNSQHSGCPNGCLGAIPRKPSILMNTTTNTYPGRRYTKGRIADLQNRLPPIKEFKSPAKVPTPSPVHISNPRLRYASYTKSTNPNEIAPLLRDQSPPLLPSTKNLMLSSTSLPITKQSSKLGLTSKVSPITSKMSIKKNGLTSTINDSVSTINNNNNIKTNLIHSSSSKTFPVNSKLTNINNNSNSNNNIQINGNTRTLLQNHLHHYHPDEKADNKKNETMEKKKKEEKLKLKAEKEARKEEKRLAKEEERLAKILAKEEKKKVKREAKEMLLANDGNKK